jgi:hypothetical protein
MDREGKRVRNYTAHENLPIYRNIQKFMSFCHKTAAQYQNLTAAFHKITSDPSNLQKTQTLICK